MTRWILVLWPLLFIFGCLDKTNLAKSSFGDHKDAQAGSASVISMGRDDDDGAAVKWHIGGGQD